LILTILVIAFVETVYGQQQQQQMKPREGDGYDDEYQEE